jgi:hypothetical protein
MFVKDEALICSSGKFCNLITMHIPLTQYGTVRGPLLVPDSLGSLVLSDQFQRDAKRCQGNLVELQISFN